MYREEVIVTTMTNGAMAVDGSEEVPLGAVDLRGEAAVPVVALVVLAAAAAVSMAAAPVVAGKNEATLGGLIFLVIL